MIRRKVPIVPFLLILGLDQSFLHYVKYSSADFVLFQSTVIWIFKLDFDCVLKKAK